VLGVVAIVWKLVRHIRPVVEILSALGADVRIRLTAAEIAIEKCTAQAAIVLVVG
jgi:hypothetical protein